MAVYCGETKPKNLEFFFEDFVNEISLLKEFGICLGEAILKFNYEKCVFICDSPAQAFIKSVKGHSGYFACQKCTTEGAGYDGKVKFPQTDAALRTDEAFSNRTCEGHHIPPYADRPSPLERLGTKMVSQVPLDYMHVICLGVVRWLVKQWRRGCLRARLPSRQISRISELLLSSAPKAPCEFNRQPKSLEQFSKWKASECRQFLLYLGLVVLKNVLKSEIYDNFVLLSLGTRLLVATDRSGYDDGGKLLLGFVEHARQIYGADRMTYIVHNVMHLVNDCNRLGSLDTFSAFPFESHNGKIKKMVRGTRLPLVQLHHRIMELESHIRIPTSEVPIKGPHQQGPIPNLYNGCAQFKIFRARDFTYRVNDKDNYVCLSGGIFAKILNFLSQNGNIVAVYRRYTAVKSLFTYPTDSLSVGIGVVDKLDDRLTTVPVSSILRKCYAIEHDGALVLIPLCHSN